MALKLPLAAFPGAFVGALVLGRVARSGSSSPSAPTPVPAAGDPAATSAAQDDGWGGFGDTGTQFPGGNVGGVLPSPIGSGYYDDGGAGGGATTQPLPGGNGSGNGSGSTGGTTPTPTPTPTVTRWWPSWMSAPPATAIGAISVSAKSLGYYSVSGTTAKRIGTFTTGGFTAYFDRSLGVTLPDGTRTTLVHLSTGTFAGRWIGRSQGTIYSKP